MSSVPPYNSTVSLDDERTRIVMIVDHSSRFLYVFNVDRVAFLKR